jgi:hypothetical protein
MDNLITLYYGGSVKEDVFGNITFDGTHRVSLIFNNRPLFSEVFARARDELQCNSNENAIFVKGAFTLVNWARFSDGWSQLQG